MKQEDNIEKWFRQEFENYRVTPSRSLWPRILKSIRWKEFLYFTPSHFNVYYLSAILMVTAGIYLSVTMHAADNSKIAPAKTMILEKHSPVENNNNAANKIITTSSVEKTVKKESIEAKENTEKNEQNGLNQKQTTINNTGKNSKVIEEVNFQKKQPLGENKGNTIVSGKNKGSKASPSIKKVRVPVLSSQKSPLPETMPEVKFLLLPKSGCAPLHVQLLNQSKYCNRYYWTIENDAARILKRNADYTFNKPGTYVISLTGINLQGDKAEWKDSVTVYGLPKAKFEIYPKEAMVPENEITFYNYSENAVRYQWDFGDNHSSTAPEPIHRYSSEGPFTIVLKAWSPEGCMDSVVRKNAFENNRYYIRFPNAFIPNPNGPCDGFYTETPGFNNVFHPIWEGVTEYHLQIYNRLGELIFESNDLQRGWDGYILDKMAKPDVYIWKAQGTFVNGKPYVRFGNVTLIKKKN